MTAALEAYPLANVTIEIVDVVPTGSVAAHGGSQLSPGSPCTLKAPGAAQAAKTLVKASLEGWDANLDHIMLAHSDPLATVNGTYSTAVVAD